MTEMYWRIAKKRRRDVAFLFFILIFFQGRVELIRTFINQFSF